MDTKTANPLSQYFGEMDKKNARTKALNNIFEQIQPHKGDDHPVIAMEAKTQSVPQTAEALH